MENLIVSEIHKLICNIPSFETNTAAANNCEKNPAGKCHICIDQEPLNKALKICHYSLAVIEGTDF